jgi:FAD/FMN-containing dehydrogenase
VLDLSRLKAINIDPGSRTVRVEPGATWGEVNAALQHYDLAVPSGDTASVGVGGLTTGGGIGWLVRKHGLTIDSLLSVDIVTADGRPVTASRRVNPELFWGVRGGGGNFGIATSFEFLAHPVGLIVGGGVFYDATNGKEVLRRYIEYASEAPGELSTILAVMHAPPLPFIPPEMHGRLVVAIAMCYAGDLDEGQRVVAPLRNLSTPVADVVGPMPYPAIYPLTEAGTANGFHHDVRSMFAQRLDDAALESVLRHSNAARSPFAMAQLRVLGGAMARVPNEATAFSHRDKRLMFTSINTWQDPQESEEQRAWTEQFWRDMQGYADGVYVNFLGDEGEERIREAYGPATYRRLAALKAQYDPTNFFRLNQNIKPLVQQSAGRLPAHREDQQAAA